MAKYGAGHFAKPLGKPFTFMDSGFFFFLFPFICLVAVKLLLDNNISDWVFIVIVCNVAVPAGHSQDCGSVVIDAHKLLVRDSPCLDGVKI